MIKKAAKRLYFLIQLKRAHASQKDLCLFYSTCVRSVIDYAVPVFHYALPAYLMQELKGVQKRAKRIICPDMEYQHALALTNLPSVGSIIVIFASVRLKVFSMIAAINSGNYCHPYMRASTILGTRGPSAYRAVKQIDLRIVLLWLHAP